MKVEEQQRPGLRGRGPT